MLCRVAVCVCLCVCLCARTITAIIPKLTAFGLWAWTIQTNRQIDGHLLSSVTYLNGCRQCKNSKRFVQLNQFDRRYFIFIYLIRI